MSGVGGEGVCEWSGWWGCGHLDGSEQLSHGG